MNKIDTNFNRKAPVQDGFEKGRLFEAYVIKLFNENYFRLETWRKSEKINDKLKLLTHGFPDLELVFVGQKNYKFAIECKWRKQFVSGKITWATYSQIHTYKTFERRSGIPVFVAIGVGGTPSQPDKLFVTPFCNICTYRSVYENELIPYKRRPSRRFFFDTVQLKLF